MPPSKEDSKLFQFEIVTVNAFGAITNRERKQAFCQIEDLGNGVVLEMVGIKGGTFVMGSTQCSNEEPQHSVIIQPFYMGKYPVTQAQWEAVMGNNPSYFKGKNRPVENVSWNDSVKFCQLLSEKTGKSYRLPSEAEWEYSCRAGATTPFYFGETITTDLANYNSNQTTNVGCFPPNAFGLYDMHGNVWEWCADPWHDNYEGAPTDGRVWEIEKREKGFLSKLFGKGENPNSNIRLLRGGSWNDVPSYCRCAYRYRLSTVFQHGERGLRFALSATAASAFTLFSLV